MALVTIDGLQTYYEDKGSGPAVALLHNGFSCTRMWDEIFPGLVDAGYRVIRYDRRGYGRSEEGADFEAFYTGDGFRDQSVAAFAALMDHLGVERLHIVGQCEGGVVGADFAACFPDRVATLTTASTMCFSTMDMVTFNREKFGAPYANQSEDLKAKYVLWHGPARAERFFNLCTTKGGAYGCGVFDLRPTLRRVACPTLVMYPDRGYFFEVEQAVAFYRSLARGELAVFAYCGHNIHEYYPDLYRDQVLRFLRRHHDKTAAPC